MNRLIFIIISLLLILTSSNAQTVDCPTCPPNGDSDQSEYDVIKTKNMMYEGEFVPGEILIKYKDEVTQVLGKSNKGTVITGISAIDAIFEKHQITEAKKLFPQAKRLKQKQILKSFNGYEFERPSLHNIHKLKISEKAKEINIYEVIEELKQIPELEYAEPNYIFAIVEDEALSPELSEEEMIEWLETNSNQKINKSTNSNVVVPNDPLYNQQWGIPATQVDLVWDTTTGDTTQIIAILDTGVDWLHPDLKNKIWRNKDEIADNGIDDDGNGLIDDIRGWDYIGWDNNPMDLNGHGTHVAGIAAAEGNNEIGITGVSWGAKILPIKIISNDGRGDAAIIAQGINYASSLNASIINMSFGGYWYSLVLSEALKNATITSELVAAAGNDGQSIYSRIPIENTAMYPAAFPFVLGVEVTEKFSNYDPDGPIYSSFETGLNYELKSYGGDIISTFRGGTYKSLSGTSMGAPLVSGIIALYNSHNKFATRESRWADFINLSNPVDAYKNIFSTDKKPLFDLRHFEITDTLLNNDYDNQADANETIHLWARIRNVFGPSDSAFIKLKLSDASREYTNYITFIKDEVFLGGIGSYNEKDNRQEPFIFFIEADCPNEDNLQFELLMWDISETDTFKQVFDISVFNGTELTGLLYGDITLTPDRLWMINGSTRLTAGSTMKIMPGTNLIINGSFDNRGNINLIGKPDSLIRIEGYGNILADTSKYVIYELNGTTDLQGGIFENCTINNCVNATGKFIKTTFNNIEDIRAGKLELCTINGMYSKGYAIHIDTLINCVIQNSMYMYSETKYIENCLFINNFYDNWNNGPNFGMTNFVKNNIFQGLTNYVVHFYPNYESAWVDSWLFELNQGNSVNFIDNAFIINRDMKFYNIFKTSGQENEINLPNQYFGTNNLSKIKKWIIDFEDNAGIPLANLIPMKSPPSDSVHGFVWKVLINGKDAQDEIVDPLGVGKQRFDVYFNRPMDPNYTPKLSFGGIFPYTTYSVNDSSSWSSDYKIWTAYHNMKLYSGDGISRIRVSSARDTEDFEIPIEDQRFEFVIDAAGLSSTDFNAIAGLGKIELDWKQPEDVIDLLGYNIYRFTNLTDTTYTDTLLINNELITDSTYTDYNVIPGKNYYYQYSVIKTDFNESDLSKVVGTQALTSSPGDANGDLAVNVLDITSVVRYLLNENPQPFIFEAADVDTNGVINVLDIVKSINIIMGVTTPNLAAKEQSAELAVHGNSIRIKEGEEISGIEFKVIGEGIENADIIGGALLAGMEYSHSYNKDTLKVLVYNFKNKPFNAKDGELLKLSKGKIISVDEIAAGDMNGNVVNINGGSSEVMIPDNYILYQNYPNPFNPTTTIRYGLTKSKDVEINIYNILGQRIKTFTINNQMAGYHEVQWNSTNNNGYKVATGVYIYQIKAGNFITQKKMMLLK